MNSDDAVRGLFRSREALPVLASSLSIFGRLHEGFFRVLSDTSSRSISRLPVGDNPTGPLRAAFIENMTALCRKVLHARERLKNYVQALNFVRNEQDSDGRLGGAPFEVG